jgi:hypothetical protein
LRNDCGQGDPQKKKIKGLKNLGLSEAVQFSSPPIWMDVGQCVLSDVAGTVEGCDPCLRKGAVTPKLLFGECHAFVGGDRVKAAAVYDVDLFLLCRVHVFELHLLHKLGLPCHNMVEVGQIKYFAVCVCVCV